jgi:hypothetical protein
MGKIIEVDEKGGLYLPPDVLGDEQPHTRYMLEAQNGTITITRLGEEQPFWANISPEERANRFWEWAMNLPEAPALPGENFSRDSIYD